MLCFYFLLYRFRNKELSLYQFSELWFPQSFVQHKVHSRPVSHLPWYGLAESVQQITHIPTHLFSFCASALETIVELANLRSAVLSAHSQLQEDLADVAGTSWILVVFTAEVYLLNLCINAIMFSCQKTMKYITV